MSTQRQPPADEERASVLENVSEAIAALYESELGRRPSSARTFWSGPDAVSCFLEHTLTRAERNRVGAGDHASVRDSRSRWQYATATAFCEPVERITGRTVRSLQSSTDTRADGLSAETFLLVPEGKEGPSRREPTQTVEAPGAPAARSVDPAEAEDELTPAERASAQLVRKVVKTGDLAPLFASLRNGEQGREDVRRVLEIMVELDRDRVVEIAVDALIEEYTRAARPGGAERDSR